MELLRSPLGIGAVAGCLLAVAWLLLRPKGNGRTVRGAGAPVDLPEVEHLIKQGNFARAAAVAADADRLSVALELYLRAQQPESAASIAMRMGNMKQAAELYERANNWERAIACFDKAGMTERAEMLRRDKLQLTGQRNDSMTVAGSQLRRGQQMEADFRRQQALSNGSESDRATLQSLARTVADALLADGDMRRAADVLRDAELHDEAIHLYVNVLGEPGLAAPILAHKGNHERAAELYEMAGQNERAATTWVQIARAAVKPEIFLDRIERLSRDVASTFLEQHTGTIHLDKNSVEMFYRHAALLAKKGDSQRALGVYQQISGLLVDYKDVASQMALLQSGKSLKEPDIALSLASVPSVGTPALPAFSEKQIAALAEQVAKAAGEQIRAQQELHFSQARPQDGSSPHVGVLAAGLESSSIEIEHLFDALARHARGGPSIAHLQQFIGNRPCDLQNIEVYYRIGLAHLGQGQWQDALFAFDQVDEASPGYRDAWKRAAQIREWQQALGKKLTMLGAAAGESTGRYQVFGELGRGGMAVVYRGKDAVLGREVALKFLSEALSSDPEMKEMFQREARAVAALNHPNIVTIHDVGQLESRAFICMEFVDGKSIETLMLEPPGLTIIESLRAIKQALDGLAYAHGKKIIHRDVKPANIMRTSSGLVKLMDFGLAKSLDGKSGQSMIAGTPAYMALEQIRGGELDNRVDLFAIGVTLYELLAGQMPFEGLDRQTAPVPLSDLVPAAPAVLEQMIMAAIDNDPNKRPATAQLMIEPIENVLSAVAQAGSGGAAVQRTSPVGGTEIM